MSLLVDEYRRNWAVRFLREANSDLSTAEKTPIQVMSISFSVMAMRKAQTSVYYSLGDPSYLAMLVNGTIEGNKAAEDPTMKFLTNLELIIRSCANQGERLEKNTAINNARTLIGLASKMVSLMTGLDSGGFA